MSSASLDSWLVLFLVEMMVVLLSYVSLVAIVTVIVISGLLYWRFYSVSRLHLKGSLTLICIPESVAAYSDWWFFLGESLHPVSVCMYVISLVESGFYLQSSSKWC